MVDALRAAGGHAYFTIFGDLGHNCWTTTYSDLRLYDWLLANRRGGKPVAPPSTQPSGQRAK